MDKKTKYLFIIFFVLILLSASATFWRYVIRHDYTVINTEEEVVDEGEILDFSE